MAAGKLNLDIFSTHETPIFDVSLYQQSAEADLVVVAGPFIPKWFLIFTA